MPNERTISLRLNSRRYPIVVLPIYLKEDFLAQFTGLPRPVKHGLLFRQPIPSTAAWPPQSIQPSVVDCSLAQCDLQSQLQKMKSESQWLYI